mgnify:CR=1 FL=1
MTMELATTLLGFVATVAVWSYSTFQTKESARDTYSHLDKRLDRIEEMLRDMHRRNIDCE